SHHANEIVVGEVGIEKLATVVARGAADHLDLKPSARKVELVVHADEPLQVVDAVTPDEARHRTPGFVHVGLGPGEGDEVAVDPHLGREGELFRLAESAAMALGQAGDHVGAEVVTCARVLRPGVAETHDEQVGCGPGAVAAPATQQADQPSESSPPSPAAGASASAGAPSGAPSCTPSGTAPP